MRLDRQSVFAIVAILLFAGPADAQQAPNKLIESAATAHAAFQKKGGMQAVNEAIAECWQTSAAQATFDAAVFCSALNFTAANFDAQFLNLLVQRGYTAPRAPLSMEQANGRAKRALIVAGVPEARVPELMDDIRRRVIAATNKRF